MSEPNNEKATEKKSAPQEGETPVRKADKPEPEPPKEVGGPKGPEPTRYGDWERKGRCIDF